MNELTKKFLKKVTIQRTVEGIELTFNWSGGHGINVYDHNGKEVDFYNVGDFSKDSATVENVMVSIMEYELYN